MLKGAFTSPKIRVFAAKIGVPFPHALGMCGMLWNFTADHAPCGDIGRHDDASIAIALEWPNDPTALVTALVAARLLDVHLKHRLIVHDWADHCPQYVRAKVARMGLSLVRTSEPTSANVETPLARPLEWTAFTSASASTSSHTYTHTSQSVVRERDAIDSELDAIAASNGSALAYALSRDTVLVETWGKIPRKFATERTANMPLLANAVREAQAELSLSREDAAAHVAGRIVAYCDSDTGRSEYRGKLATWLKNGRWRESDDAWKRTAEEKAKPERKLPTW